MVWIQPGRTSRDSMPLGNGETALNVWTLPGGEIVFYIARTDAWSGLGRLLKLGKVHVKLEPNPFDGAFEQTLDLRNGQVLITGAGGFEARVWVDANAQTVHVDAVADSPFTMEARTELLRPETRPLDGSENHSAYSMHGAPQEHMIVEADTLAPAKDNAVSWFHRNGMSAYQVMMKQQALDELLDRMQDPIMNRTFGCLMQGANLKAENDATLKSIQPSNAASLQLFTHTAITDSAADWQAQIEKLAASAEPEAEAYAAHKAWWNAFWERSWIFAEGEKPAFYPDNPIYDSTMRRKLHIGADNGGGGAFTGRIARASVFDYPLNAAQVKSLYEAGREGFGPLEPAFKHTWTLDGAVDGKVPDKGTNQKINMLVRGPLEFVEDGGRMVAEFKGDGRLEIEHARGDLRLGGTAEAWIKPAGTDAAGGRIFSLRAPGARDQGWILETLPDGGSLRGIYRVLQAEMGGVLKPGEWSHVAMAFDCFHGELRLYVNGEEVARDDYMTHHKQDAAPGIWQMSQGYALQRFISACAGRGNYPIKFNGSLFTMDGTTEYLGGKIAHDADFRMWGPDYWFQNTRLPYWPMIAAGDFDLMESFWQLYLDTLPMAKERARIYYGHGGAYWPETITFWGTFNGQNYGWSGREGLPAGESKNTHIRYYFDGALELLTMMLDRYEHAPDETFFQEKILPIATEVLEFYDVHYPRDAEGKLRLKPSQAMETYQWERYKIENPVNVIAGLQSVTTRMIQYGEKAENPDAVERWKNLLAILPAIPVNPVTGTIKVAENFERHRIRGNGEEPALYTVFPYQLYGVGRPYLDKVMPTFDEVYPPYGTGWNQDHVFAAQLGRTDVAAPLVYQAFTRNGDAGCRFPAFWGPNYDWVPDQDHGGSAQNALQRMLIQSVGDKIHLLPAWPQDWDVNFKLHAAQNTTVEMVVRKGTIEKLEVRPASRRADCVLPDWLGGERKSCDGPGVSAPVKQGKSVESKQKLIENAVPVAPLSTYITADELPRLRTRLNSGRAAELMQVLRVTADRFLNISTEPLDTDGPYIGRNLQSYVGVLGIVGLVDENPKYLAKGREILMAAVNQNDLEDYLKANTHLSVGDAAAALALGYDWIGAGLTEPERSAVLAELDELGEYLYEDSNHPENGQPYKAAHNHSVVVHSGLLLAGHVLGRKDWVEYATPWVRDYLQLFQDGSGAPYEGIGYSDYGMMMGLMSVEVLRRNCGIDLFSEVAGLDKMPGFLLHSTVPWGGEIIPLNQTSAKMAGVIGYYYIINRLRDSVGLYAWESLLGPAGIAGLKSVGHDSHFRMFPFLALWTNNDVSPMDPRRAGVPLFKTYDRGMVFARTAWNDPDAGLVTFQSARQVFGIWDHPDENSFTFTAFGDNLIIDPGPHLLKNDQHNQILIDGRGFPGYRGPGHRTQGTIELAEDRGDSVYMVGNATDAYRLDSFEKESGMPVERAERRLLFVRAKEPFLVVSDKLTMTDGKQHAFTLRTFYANRENRNTVDFNGNRAVITGGRNGAVGTMHFLQLPDPSFEKMAYEGKDENRAEAFDLTLADADAAEFLAVITTAPKGAKPAVVTQRGKRIQIELSNGEKWAVDIAGDDMTVVR